MVRYEKLGKSTRPAVEQRAEGDSSSLRRRTRKTIVLNFEGKVACPGFLLDAMKEARRESPTFVHRSAKTTIGRVPSRDAVVSDGKFQDGLCQEPLQAPGTPPGTKTSL